MKELSGQRALVTGGTSGIGRATAEALAREGAHVLISGRNEARGAEVVAAIEAAGGKAEFVRADRSMSVSCSVNWTSPMICPIDFESSNESSCGT